MTLAMDLAGFRPLRASKRIQAFELRASMRRTRYWSSTSSLIDHPKPIPASPRRLTCGSVFFP
jgi:hypothetical protein